MKEWFGGKRTKKTDNDEWERLHRKLDRLEREVQMLSARREPNRITVEHLEIHNPHLENLTFRLDTLDIDELSGVLNLGNNFSSPGKAQKKSGKNSPPAPDPVSKSEKSGRPDGRAETDKRTERPFTTGPSDASDGQTRSNGMSHTKSGYSVRLGKQE